MSRARVVLLAALLALAAGAIGPGPQAAGAHGSGHIDTSWRNPVVPVTAAGTDTPDPWIFRWRGRYWLTYTTGQWIEVRSAKRLAGLAAARPTRLWPRLGSTEPADRCCELWAPEIHRLRGPRGPRWYVYYAAKGASDGLVHRLYVLESARDDPAGPYRFRGQLRVPQVYAIDATVASIRGRTYLIYSGGSTFAPTSLYLARLSDPWTVSGTPIEISRPTLPWETIPFAINEGPEFLLHGGSLHVIYSASWCGTGAYKLGRLTVPRNADLLDPATWSGAKYPDPVFQSAPDRGVYGPGHGSFFTSPDGRESWMVYHATDDNRGCFTGGLRTTRAQRFTWNVDDTPDFGTPVSLATDIAAPGGDRTIAVQAEDAVRGPSAPPSPLVQDRRLFGYQGLRVEPAGASGALPALWIRVPRAGRYTVRLRVLGGPEVGVITLVVGHRRAVRRSARRASEQAVELNFGVVRLGAGVSALSLRSRSAVTLDQVRLQPRR